jgi:serine/threonine protein kinase
MKWSVSLWAPTKQWIRGESFMTDLTGKTIGQYQLIEVIHRGQNTIYKGFQPSMNRYVAVKVLNPSLAADPAFVEEFRQEMGRIAALEHPNILSIYDYGQQDELLYIVTRYVDHGSLRNRLPPAYTPHQAQGIIKPIAAALDYLHSQGIVDGNLKPTNILIASDGQPLLADLGYAQGIDVGEREQVYLSPEQAQGAFADERTDVYALGALLYEMLVGEAPPLGAVPSPRGKRPDLPIEVEKIILKAMAQYPEQRFQTAGELSRALDAALAPKSGPQPQPSPAPPPQAQPSAAPPPPPAPEPRRSPSWLVFLLGGLAFLCVVACVLGLLFGVSGNGPAAAPVPTATAAPGVEPPAPPPPPDGSLIQGFFDMIKNVFDNIVRMIESILGGITTPEPPTEQPPPTEPPVEQPVPLPEQPDDSQTQPTPEGRLIVPGERQMYAWTFQSQILLP